MNTRRKVALIVLGAGLPALALTPVLFPLNPSLPKPGNGLLPFFAGLVAIETLFFGMGVAFLVLGLPVMRRLAAVSKSNPWPAFLSMGYVMTSWWPHLGMHRVAGVDPVAILLVDVAFHLPYILAAGVVTLFFVKTVHAMARREDETNAIRRLPDDRGRGAGTEVGLRQAR